MVIEKQEKKKKRLTVEVICFMFKTIFFLKNKIKNKHR
jgi:hypothetical protein